MEKNKSKLILIDSKIEEAIQSAKKIYFEGNVFVYPTDTIYGFGANPFNEDSVKKVNTIKGREEKKKFILLISDIKNLLNYVEINSEKFLDFFLEVWPNPVSIVLKLNAKTSDILGDTTAAFRIPNNRFCLRLLDELKMPLISTSVNRTNEPPLLEPQIIEEQFSADVDAIFYTVKKSYYEASTLIDMSNGKLTLLREGKIKFNDLLEKFNK
jgi:L-threonylcarbamoyladenylate synthase